MLNILKSKIYFLLILTFIASCAKNPVSGMPDFVTITEQQEVEMGRAYHKEILKNSKVLDNKELTKYYVELGENYINYATQVVLLAFLFSLTSITLWTFIGKFLRKFATNDKFIKYFNYAMSGLLLLSIITFYI